MHVDQAKSLIQQQVKNLSDALEAGQSESLTAFLSTMAKFHKYSLGNALLIAFQRPDATHVAGFNTWKSLGRYVRRGEKGIAILAPMLLKGKAVENECSSDERTGADLDTSFAPTEEPRKQLRFRVVYVYDIAQTEGPNLPEFASVQGNPGDYADRLKSLVRQLSIELTYSDKLGGADGVSKEGFIALRPDLAPAEEFSVLVHELAHVLMHCGETREGTTKTIRETEAEAVAFVVSQAIGLDVGNAASDYIQLYQGDKEVLTRSLEGILKTAEQILSALLD